MGPRIALVHDWLVSQRGGEAVLEGLARMVPDAPIYTLVSETSQISSYLRSREIRTSFLQNLPGAGPSGFRKFLPIFPKAVASWDFSEFDLILSTSHCVVKAAGEREGVPHISYIHSPMRYIWDQWSHYAPKSSLARGLLTPIRQGLQAWDRSSSQRSTLRLIANSQFVAERIRRVWNRESQVVYPPVDSAFFRQTVSGERTHWCVLSALVPYKRIDLAVEWANAYQQPLVIIGDGPEREHLMTLAGPTVSFRGRASRAEVQEVFAQAYGLLFPGVEDFGIVPLEAMAAGVPVVAFGQGGALETVVPKGPSRSGAFFYQAEPEAIEEAAQEVLTGWAEDGFNRASMLNWVEEFSEDCFDRALRAAIRSEAAALGLPNIVI